ncbi:MAG: hypothetical protein LBC94_08420 [Desulfovibrio sp.]|jgi:hypothetical protein|nr:hypothetical protein [Desulfovibrio sp.]
MADKIAWQTCIAAVLNEAFPGFVFRYGKRDFNTYEVASPTGLLPLIALQIQACLSMSGIKMRGLTVERSPDSGITGNMVVLGPDASAGLILPFLLDAVYLAKGLTREKYPQEAENVIRLECISPPLGPLSHPSLRELLSAPTDAPAEEQLQAGTAFTPL